MAKITTKGPIRTTVNKSLLDLELLENYVMVQVDKQPDKSEGGIVLPERSREKPHVGTVLAVGPGLISVMGDLIPTKLNVDERVMYDQSMASEVEFKGVKYLLMKESDVFAVLKKS